MHSLPTQELVNRFRLLAFLLVLSRVLVPCWLGLLVYALVRTDWEKVYFSLGLLGVILLLMLIQWLLAARARCPLCLGPPLSRNACVKHRDARKLLGSYRSMVAVSIIFRGLFKCPYCGESTAIQSRRYQRMRRRNRQHY
jgi:hypothetical protein